MLNNKEYLNKIFQSNKPLIIYKTIGGYDVYTDFKEKITLNSKNFKNFLNKKTLQSKSPIKELNCYVGFFGFQLLCENIKIKNFNEILLNSDLGNKEVIRSPKKSETKLLPIENYINFKDSGKIPDFLM